MKIFRADYVFPVNADPIRNGAIVVNDDGKIISVAEDIPPEYANITVDQLTGVIVPGFVNTHCHVELSHLQDKVPSGEGLIPFIQNIQLHRNADRQVIELAATAADEAMYNNGIVAVGDIANSDVTINLKSTSKLYYHTFVEAFAFLPQKAEEALNKAVDLLGAFKPQHCSITPHAPYSVSKELFRMLKKYADQGKNLLSMHNQECEDENKFFRYKLGRFNDLYAYFGIDISFFKPQARNSVQSVLPLLSHKQEILLVHNTCTNLKDIYFIKRFDHKIHWCFCPNANMYIEGTLPKIDLFIDQGFNITLGTDSLASNRKLCILSEMATLQKHFPDLQFSRLLQWGTINGAKFLGIDNEMGTIEPGKTPGLNLITGLSELKITDDTEVRRLI